MADLQDRYRFLSVVGEGGFGRVYRARLEAVEGFHKEVAIKVLQDPNPSARLLMLFKDEARILGMVRDRAVVNVEPPVRFGNNWALVMEFVEGINCGELLRSGPMPPGVATEIVAEVARALHNVYNMEGPDNAPLHLLHRDLKPDNIQITPSGEVKILDFGIARADFARREFKTRHTIGGTPGYIAPERVNGVEGPGGDVFSLGVVLHELATGAKPKHEPTSHVPDDVSDDGSGEGPDREAELAATVGTIPLLDGDPILPEVLALSARMRSADPGERPTARDVERECRRIRRATDGPYLREWAEEFVRPPTEASDDELVGQVVQARTTDPIDTLEPGGRPMQPDSLEAPRPATRTTTGSTSASGVTRINPPVAAAAAVGVIGAGILSASVAFLMVVAVVLWMRPERTGDDRVAEGPAPSSTGPVTPAPTDGPAPEPTPDLTAPAPAPEPAPVADAEPGDAAPRATAPRPAPAPKPGRKAAPEPAPAATPTSGPAPGPQPAAPAVASVQVRGDVGEVWLMRGGERFDAGGAVPPGTYAVWAVFQRTGETRTEASLTAESGVSYVITCKDAFTTCKVTRAP